MQGYLIGAHAEQADDDRRKLTKLWIAFHGGAFEFDQLDYMQFATFCYQIYNLAEGDPVVVFIQ